MLARMISKVIGHGSRVTLFISTLQCDVDLLNKFLALNLDIFGLISSKRYFPRKYVRPSLLIPFVPSPKKRGTRNCGLIKFSDMLQRWWLHSKLTLLVTKLGSTTSVNIWQNFLFLIILITSNMYFKKQRPDHKSTYGSILTIVGSNSNLLKNVTLIFMGKIFLWQISFKTLETYVCHFWARQQRKMLNTYMFWKT